MFAKAINIGFAQRVVATLVASALVMVSYGFYNTAQAANLNLISNTLSNSAPSELSGHTIAFTVPAGSALTSGDTVTITFPAGFVDVDQLVTGDLTVTANTAPATHTSFNATGQVVTFDGVAAAAGEEVVVAIADDVITNPSLTGNSESHEFEISTGVDTGKTRVVIIDNTVVTAIVSTSFEFTVTGTTTAADVNGQAPTIDSTDTTIPFGELTAGTAEMIAQELTVTTNSKNGFTVTVESDGDLRSSTGAVIDNFVDGSDLAVNGTQWAVPSNDVNDDTTWGHWGMTTNDTDVALDLAANNDYVAASTTPREIFSHTGSADGVTQDIGKALVGYQVEISPLQEAGDDYQTTLTYIATPTF